MSAATDKTNLAELRRTMTLWHNRVTALGFDGVSDLIALAEAGGEEMKKAWPIGERVELKLMMIKQIGEGSTTANSLPHVARIAIEAMHLIRCHRAGIADTGKGAEASTETCPACHADFSRQDADIVWQLERPDQRQIVCPECQSLLTAQVPHE